MKNLSELTVNSVIESTEEGMFIKSESKTWSEIQPHCSECMVSAHEDGVDPSQVGDYSPEWSTEKPAQEFFGEYKVLAIGVVDK